MNLKDRQFLGDSNHYGTEGSFCGLVPPLLGSKAESVSKINSQKRKVKTVQKVRELEVIRLQRSEQQPGRLLSFHFFHGLLLDNFKDEKENSLTTATKRFEKDYSLDHGIYLSVLQFSFT